MEYVAAAGGVLSILGALSGGGDSTPTPPTPTVAAPTVMPTPDDEAAKAMKKKQAMALSQRRGRQSTILSDPTSTDLLGA